MVKRIFASAVIFFTCAGWFLIGCNGINGPDSTTNDESTTFAETFDVTTLASQTSLLKSTGVNTDSANAFFVLRWSYRLNHVSGGDTVTGHASAVAYNQPSTLRDRNALGLDMGTVSVITGLDTIDLSKFAGIFSGVRYGMFGGFGGNRPPNGGCDGPRGGRGGHHGHGGGPRGNGVTHDSLTIVNIPFIGGGAYQFDVTGSESIPAMTLDIQAPAQLVQITGLADRDSIDATQDLTVTWDGDAAANNTVLVLAPAFGRGHGRSAGQSVEPVFIQVDAAAGSFAISAQALQDLLSAADAEAFSLHLSQSIVNEITDARVGKILVSAGSDDQVILTVK